MANKLMMKRGGELAARSAGSAASIERREDASNSFKSLMASKAEQADAVIEKIASAVAAASVADELADGQKQTTRYVVNMSKETKEALDKGLIRLDRGKDGQLYAQLRDADSHYGKKLSISEELVDQGVDTLDAVNALQLKAIQEQLKEMAEAIDAIGRDVEDVLQGQQNDRLALYRSGESLFLEAQSIQDPAFKAILSSQALKSLSDASAQLAMQMQSDIRYLSEGRYKERRGRQSEEIASRMESINKSFEVIHRAAFLKASIYYEAGELSAMLAAVSDYGRFLESEVVPHAPRLAEFDSKDNLLRGGVWETRSRSLSNVEEIKSQLQSGSVFYLQAPEEGEPNEG